MASGRPPGRNSSTITDWDPPNRFESDELAFGIPVQFVMEVLATETGSTLRIMYEEPGDGALDDLEPIFREAAKGALTKLAALLEEPGS